MNTRHVTILRAESVLERMRGLLARAPLRDGEALYLAPCSSVHTCFMRYAIDIAFVDRHGCVLKIVRGVAPWRAALCWSAYGTVEMAAGGLQSRGIRVGDAIALGPAPGGAA